MSTTTVMLLGQALRLLEAEASEIEHRMAFVRAAIEAFGLDADSLLMDVIAEEERTTLPYDVPEAVVLTPFGWNNDAPETAQQDGPEEPDTPYRTSGRWNWPAIARLIDAFGRGGRRRVLGLCTALDVNATTARWMVKRCREQGLIDIDRPAVNHQAARDAAAAAL
ncbi:MAG: hypothetical protein ACO3S5_12435 [Ilumatobacteraceae bacterium]